MHLSLKSQSLIALTLLTLMIATRGQHFPALNALPSPSWAVFFLAGFYLRSVWVFVGLLAAAAGLDFTAVGWAGVSDFCITPAYAFLLPAYGALWLSGRLYAGHYRFAWSNLPPLLLYALLGALACELFSSGGFYFFSGRFADPQLPEFAGRIGTYFPAYLGSMLCYIGLAVAIHITFYLSGRGAVPARDALTG